MSIVRVKNKYQVVIPESVRDEIRVEVGDMLEARVERGKITLTPKSFVDREIAEGLADLKKGRTYGPYGTPDEAIKVLHGLVKKKEGRAVKRSR
jgi:AbrB family looped-hinge helix DNA binding protein